MSIYSVGDLLPSGATVTIDEITTDDNGVTVEYMQDSAGNQQTITTTIADPTIIPVQADPDALAAVQTAITKMSNGPTKTALQALYDALSAGTG